jgi:LacI family transcriptional regulator
VPKDVAFVELFVESEDGSMAGVRENCFRVGEVAVEVLVSSLHQNSTGIPPIATSTLVEGTWIDGASLPPQG